jgi:hypothetical protein
MCLKRFPCMAVACDAQDVARRGSLIDQGQPSNLRIDGKCAASSAHNMRSCSWARGPPGPSAARRRRREGGFGHGRC